MTYEFKVGDAVTRTEEYLSRYSFLMHGPQEGVVTLIGNGGVWVSWGGKKAVRVVVQNALRPIKPLTIEEDLGGAL